MFESSLLPAALAALLAAGCGTVADERPPAACGVGRVVELTNGYDTEAGALAVDAENVYWTQPEGGTIMKVPKSGGVPEVVVSGLDHPGQILVDDNHIFVLLHDTWTGWETDPHDLVAFDKSGGNPATLLSGLVRPWGMVQDDERIYLRGTLNGVDSVNVIPKNGGEPSSLNAGLDLVKIQVDARRIYGIHRIDAKTARILAVPKLGGVPEIVSELPAARGLPALAVDDERLYYSNGMSIVAAAKSGAAPAPVAVETEDVVGILTDASCVYWISDGVEDQGYMTLHHRAAPKGGGPVVEFAPTQAVSVVTDDDGPYWLTTNGIRRLVKP